MRQRILNLLIALDSFLYVWLTLGAGYPGAAFVGLWAKFKSGGAG